MPCDTAGLGSSPFARRYLGNRSYFLFLRVLRCFSSPRSPPADRRVTGSLPPGCPIRRSTGQWVFAPRRGLSQLVTSFLASESQGIPMRPSIIPLFLDVSKYIVTGVVPDTLPKLFPYTISMLMALVVFCLSFYFVFLADSDESESRFHHVNVLFSK